MGTVLGNASFSMSFAGCQRLGIFVKVKKVAKDVPLARRSVRYHQFEDLERRAGRCEKAQTHRRYVERTKKHCVHASSNTGLIA